MHGIRKTRRKSVGGVVLATAAVLAGAALAASPNAADRFPPLVPEGEPEAILGVEWRAGQPVFPVLAAVGDAPAAGAKGPEGSSDLLGSRSGLQQVAYSPDGRLLASAGGDQVIHLWDTASGRELRRLRGHAGSVLSLAFGPDGRTLASAGADRTIRLWDTAAGLGARELPSPSDAEDVVTFSPDGRTFATASRDSVVRLWDLATGQLLQSLSDHADRVNAVAYSQDSKTLASASDDRRVDLWEVATGIKQRHQRGHAEKVVAVAFSPDGKTLASADEAGTIRLWKRPKGREIRHIRVDLSEVKALAFSPDSKLIAALTGDTTILVWDCGHGREIARAQGHPERVTSIAFAPDGQALAAAGADGSVRIFRLDGKLAMLLVSGSEGWAAWRAEQAQQHRVLRGETGMLLARRSPDGRTSPVAPDEGKSPRLTAHAELGTVASLGAAGEIMLHVANADDASPAVWVNVGARIVEPAGSTSGISFSMPATVVRLDPGDGVTLPVEYRQTRQENPLPGTHRVVLAVHHTHDGGKPIEIPVDVELRAPSFTVATREVAHDHAGYYVPVALYNVGDGATAGAVTIKAGFLLANGQDVPSDFQVAYSDELRPGAIRELTLRLPENVARAERFRIRLAVSEGANQARAPSAVRWTLESSWVSARSRAWLYLTIAVALALLGMAVYLGRLYRDPAVLAVSKDAKWLLHRHLRDLPKHARALARVRRLDEALAELAISRERWDQVLRVAREPGAAIEALVRTLGGNLLPSSGNVQLAHVPGLEARGESEVALAVLEGMQVDPGQAEQLVDAVRQAGDATALIIDLTSAGNALFVFAKLPGFSGWVLSSADLRDILLSREPEGAFEECLAAQRGHAPVTVVDEGDPIFVGRTDELARFSERELKNAIVVGGQRMGKSLLLDVVARRLAARKDVEVHHVALSGDDLVRAMASALGVPRPESIESFQKIIAGSRSRPRVWLLDNVGAFVKADLARPLPYTAEVCYALLALAEEGSTYFVLAGDWDLYQSTARDPHSPLHGLGELVRLGPLSREAAAALVREILDGNGVAVEADAIERIVEATGCRANLVALTCQGLLKQGAGKKVACADVERVFDSHQALRLELLDWKSQPLDRAVVHAALAQVPSTRTAIEARLAAAGIAPESEELDQAFARLELDYALLRRSEGGLEHWSCPVPLIARCEARAMSWQEHLAQDAQAIGWDQAAATPEAPPEERTPPPQ